MKYNLVAICLMFGMSCFVSCSDDDQTITVDNPTVYTFERNGASTVSFTGQSTRIGMATELITALKDFDSQIPNLLEMYSNQTIDGGDANPFENASFNASDKSIKSKVAASSDFFSSNTVDAMQIKADIQSWIEAQILETGSNKNGLASKGIAGQIVDGTDVRYVSAKGLEYNQAVNKALIGALMVDQICNHYLSTAILDEGNNRLDNDLEVLEDGASFTKMEHKWDEAYGYLFGATADPIDPMSSLGDDNFLNKYLSRVDSDIDFAGIASEIFEAFKLGRAAIVAGDYELRNEQAEIIKEKLAIVIAVRAVYYLQNGKKALEAQNFGTAFHDLSEGYGFVYSLQFLRIPDSADSYFSKTEVDGFIQLLSEGNGFWDISEDILDQISENIVSKFDFSITQAAE